MAGELPHEQDFALPRDELRRLLRVNERTIDSWIRDGRIQSEPGLRDGALTVTDEELNRRCELAWASDQERVLAGQPQGRLDHRQTVVNSRRRRPRGRRLVPRRLGRLPDRSPRQRPSDERRIVRSEQSEPMPIRSEKHRQGRKIGHRPAKNPRAVKRAGRALLSEQQVEQAVAQHFPPPKRRRRRRAAEPRSDLAAAFESISESTGEFHSDHWGDTVDHSEGCGEALVTMAEQLGAEAEIAPQGALLEYETAADLPEPENTEPPIGLSAALSAIAESNGDGTVVDPAADAPVGSLDDSVSLEDVAEPEPVVDDDPADLDESVLAERPDSDPFPAWPR